MGWSVVDVSYRYEANSFLSLALFDVLLLLDSPDQNYLIYSSWCDCSKAVLADVLLHKGNTCVCV